MKPPAGAVEGKLYGAERAGKGEKNSSGMCDRDERCELPGKATKVTIDHIKTGAL